MLAAGAGFFAMLQSLITPVLPTIQHDLHTSQNTVTWVLTAYLLSASIFTPILGRVGDMVGKERMLVVSLAALALGCLLAAVAPTIGVLIVARVVQGIGGAVFPLSFGIIRDEFPRRAGAPPPSAAISAIVAAGGGLGIVLAGPIVTALDYRWLFWIPMVVVGLTAAGRAPVRPRVAGAHPRPDRLARPPCCCPAGWSRCCCRSARAPAWGWTSARVLGLLALAAVLLVGWLVAETPLDQPADRHADDAPARRSGPRTWSRCSSARRCSPSTRSCRSSCRPRPSPATASARASPRPGC